MSYNRDRLEKKFLSDYEKLNEQQRIAVNHIDGPVMVIAGPGTGKTQILASTYCQNIIGYRCGSVQHPLSHIYRRRSNRDAPAPARLYWSRRVQSRHLYISCFCNDVIQENLSLFEKTSLDPISDLERIELFKQLIDAFPRNHPLKRYRGDVYFEINNLQSLFSAMKREGWTPAFIIQKIDEYIRKSSHTG